MASAILFDSVLCIGCRACESACNEKWNLPYTDEVAAEEKLSAGKLTTVRTFGERYARKLCMHCLEPACASACPVTALEKTAHGPVVYHEDRCIGCRYCMLACPFEVPVYTWNSRAPKVRKCDLCQDRTSQGLPTRCSEACPTEATITGPRNQLIQIARRRIRENPGEYYDHIYGLQEAGGTSVLMIGPAPMERLGMPAGLGTEALPGLTWRALQFVPDVVGLGTVLLGGIYWITHRREEVAAAEGPPPKSGANPHKQQEVR
jgi:formate dehydrogenase iron-sulfur subunit